MTIIHSLLNMLDFIFIHGFLLFHFGFLAVNDFYNTYMTYKPVYTENIETSEVESIISQTEPEIPSIIEVKPAVAAYESTVLTDEQKNFFSMLMMDVSENVAEETSIVEEDKIVFTETEDDILSMEKWEVNQPEVEISNPLVHESNAKINDFLMGEQSWTVQVIGEEQGYIHVSDGTARAWIDATRFPVFKKQDILSVFVNRISEICIELNDADILQRHSTEFSIHENDMDMYEEEIWTDEEQISV